MKCFSLGPQPHVGHDRSEEVKGKCGNNTVTALKVTAVAVAIAAVVFGILAALQLNGIGTGFSAIGTTGAYTIAGVGGGSLIAYLVASAISKQCHARQQQATTEKIETILESKVESKVESEVESEVEPEVEL